MKYKILSILSTICVALLCGCTDHDEIFDIVSTDPGTGFCILPVSMIGEEIPYDSVPGKSRAINAMTVDKENMIKTIAIFQFDKENNLRTLKNGQYYLYHNFAEFGSSTPNGVSLVNIDNMPELALLLTSTKADLYTCVIANASEDLILDDIMPGGSPTDWPNFKEYSFPLPMATKADVENERNNLEYGHVTDIYMFGYYDGIVPPNGFTLGLGRVVSRVKIKFVEYEDEAKGLSLDKLPATARFFAAIRNLPRTGYFYPTTETEIQRSMSDVYMLPELQFDPKSGSATLQFYCGPQLGSWIAENDRDGVTPLRTQLLLWCATNPDEYETADWNKYFLEDNIDKAVVIDFGNNPGAGDYGIVHNTVYSYTMGLGYGESGIVIKPINIFAMVWLNQFDDWHWDGDPAQETTPLTLNIGSRASKHNFELKKIFNRDWNQRENLGFVEYMIRNKRDWSQVLLKDNETGDDKMQFDFTLLSYSNLDTDRLMLVGATESGGVYTGLETEGVKLLPLANGTASFDINLPDNYNATINGTETNFTSRTVHVTVPINGTFTHTLLPSKPPVSKLTPGSTTSLANILDGVTFKVIKTYDGHTVHSGNDSNITATDLKAGTPVVTGEGITITIEDGQIVAADNANGTVTIPYTYTIPTNGEYANYKYPPTLTYQVTVEVNNISIHNIWTYSGSGTGLSLTWQQGDDKDIEPGRTNAVDAKVGDKIRITISSGNTGTIYFKNDWTEIDAWKIELNSSNTTQIGDYYIFEQELTQDNSSAIIAALKNKTLRVQGANVTITQIDLITSSMPTSTYDFAMVWQKYIGQENGKDKYNWDTEHMGIKNNELSLVLDEKRVANGFKMADIFNHSWRTPTEVAPIEYMIVDQSKNPNVMLTLKQNVETGATGQVQYDFSTITYNNLSSDYLKIEGTDGPDGVYLYPLQAPPEGQNAKFEVSIPSDPTDYTVESKKVTVDVIIDGTFTHTLSAANDVPITNNMYLDNLINDLGELTATKKYNGVNVNAVSGLKRWNGFNIGNDDIQCSGSGISFSNGQFTVAADAYGSVTLTLHLGSNGDLGTYKYPTTMTLIIPVGVPAIEIDKTLPYTFTLYKTDASNNYAWIESSKAQGSTPLDLGELGTDLNIAHLLNHDTSLNSSYGYVAHVLENENSGEYTNVELKQNGQVQNGQQEYDFSGLTYTTSSSNISITSDNKIVPLAAGTATIDVTLSTLPIGYTNIASPATVPVTVYIANSFNHQLAPSGSIPSNLPEGETALYDFLSSADFKAIKKYKNVEAVAQDVALRADNCQVTSSDDHLVYFDNGKLVVPAGATGTATITFTYTISSDLQTDYAFPSGTLSYTHQVSIGAPAERVVWTGSSTLEINGTLELENTLFLNPDIKTGDTITITGQLTANGQYYSTVKVKAYVKDQWNNEYWTDVPNTSNQPFTGTCSFTVTDDYVEFIKTSGLKVEGNNIIIEAVTLTPAN